MTARIAQGGDSIRLVGEQYEQDAGKVGTAYVRNQTDRYADVKVPGGETWPIYRYPDMEDEWGGWHFVLAEGYEISSEELATAIGLNFEGKVDEVLADVKAQLIAKNAQYGNSALEPIRAFSKLNPVEQLLIRIDDKIPRLQRGDGTGDEDAEADALGYLILLAIARKDSNA